MEWSGVLFFFAMLGYAMLIMLALPKLSSGRALLCALCGMLFVSYYGVIIAGWMVPVAYVLMYGGLAGLCAGIVCAAMNLRFLRKRLLSPGMLVFALLCAYILYGAQSVVIQAHDDMSYWARVVKELYTFDRFYIHGDATMFHTDYIPLLASLQYSIVRVFGWQDAYLTFVTSACVAASAAAMAEAFHKRWVPVVLSVLYIFAYRLFGFGMYNLRADGPMLMVFTAGLISLLSRRDDSWASLLPSVMACAVLVGFKIYSGLMFAAVILIALVVEWIAAARGKRRCRSLAVAAILSAVLMIAQQMSWSMMYNYTSAVAGAEGAAALAAHLGQPAGSSEVAISIGQLLRGNPRTSQLMQSFTPEQIETFLQLAGQTINTYVFSKLVWTWLFLIPVAILGAISSREKRAVAIKTVILLVVAALIYLLGLFGSYFVQAETSGAALNYLSTASAPLMIAALFLTAWLGQDNARAAAAVSVAVMTGGMTLLGSPALLIPKTERSDYTAEAELAVEFYEYDMDGLLTEEDFGKRALLIENSYMATEVSSKSGKTHAYAYFGLPLRVLEPIYYVYGDYTELEDFDAEWLRNMVINSRCELLLVRVEDYLYWREISDVLELYGEYDFPVGVYDVTYENGELSFKFRMPEDEDWDEDD